MKKLLLCVGLVVLFTSSTWAAPVGPGGRFYWTRIGYRARGIGDNEVRLHRVDVGTDWSLITDQGKIASLVNDYNLDTTYYDDVPYPEILHPRATPDGTPTGGDGSVFVATYFDCGVHTRYHKVTAGGTVSVLHPGVGSDSHLYPRTGDHTAEGWHALDPWGHAGGKVDAICGFADGYGSRAWQDVNSNDDLTDDCDTNVYPGYNAGHSGDGEVGPAPGSTEQDAVWSFVYGRMSYTQYTGNEADCHTWAGISKFYDYGDWTIGDGIKYRMQSGKMAVADTDDDCNVDVYVLGGYRDDALYNDPRGYVIHRMADLTGDGTINDQNADLIDIIYTDDTLGAGATTFGNNLGGGDIELVKDPATGKWTMLIFEAGSSYSGTDGRILAMELADNGDFVGSGDGLVQIIAGPGVDDGLDAGNTSSGYENRYVLLGMEFDPDPIPEPGTMLLIGTGVLGLVGYIRRRRMK